MTHRPSFSFLLCLLFSLLTFAQEPQPPPKPVGLTIATPVLLSRQPLEWQRFETLDKNFSVNLPSNSKQVSDFTAFPLDIYGKIICYSMLDVSSYVNGTVMLIEVYYTEKPNDGLKHLVEDLQREAKLGQREVTNNGIRGQELSRTAFDINYKHQIFPLNNGVLMAMTISKGSSVPLANQFWASLRVGKATPKHPVSPDETKALADIKLDWDEKAVVNAKEATTKAIILWRPAPYYTEEARHNNIEGTLLIRMLLGADGQVHQINPLTRLPMGLTEMALYAAKRIKFLPAVKDGKNVSQWVKVEYNFKLY